MSATGWGSGGRSRLQRAGAGVGRGGRGHTLVEVLLALAVMSFVALAILAGTITGEQARRSSDDIRQATAHAERVLEVLRALPFDQLDAQNGIGVAVDDMGLPEPEIGRVTVAQVSGQPSLREVAVVLDFPGAPGRPGFRVELKTRRSR